MKSILIFALAMCMLSCNKTGQTVSERITSQNDSVIDSPHEQIEDNPREQIEDGLREQIERDIYINKKFLGHEINCKEQDLPQEFARICAEDKHLSYNSTTQNVTIYGTTFHLNYRNYGGGFTLTSSVQPDTRQMRIVRDAINKFHGEGEFEEDDHYSWLPYTDSTKIGQNYPTIYLRRVRSEEGGTTIIVQ